MRDFQCLAVFHLICPFLIAVNRPNCPTRIVLNKIEQRSPRSAGQPRGAPDNTMEHPLVIIAASDAKNRMTSAMADGGVQYEGSALGIAARFCGVSMIVGITQATPIPCGR